MAWPSAAMVGAGVWKVSLLHGALPFLVRWTAPLATAVALAIHRVRPRLLIAGALAALAISVFAGHVVKPAFGLLDPVPASFMVWFALPILATIALTWPGRRRGARERVVAVAVVVLGLLFSGSEVNRHYAYLPTVGDALGRPLAHEVKLSLVTRQSPVASQPVIVPDVGQIVEVKIPSPASGFEHRPEFVYLPPAWFATPRPTLPVVMMLAGTPGTPSDWLRAASAAQTADAWASLHGGRAPILVFPDPNGTFGGDSGCVDGPRGRAETYLSVDVPAFIVERFGAYADPGHWAVAGLSEGGTCAMDLTLRHPDRFRHFADISGDYAPSTLGIRRSIHDLFGGDRRAYAAHDGRILLAAKPDQSITAAFAAGTSDHRRRGEAVDLARAATRAHLQTQIAITPGGHNYAFWTQAWRAMAPSVFDAIFGSVPTTTTPPRANLR